MDAGASEDPAKESDAHCQAVGAAQACEELAQEAGPVVEAFEEPAQAGEAAKPKLPLRLSLDVNQTVIMLDPIQGHRAEDCVALALGKSARGTVDPDSGLWQWDGESPIGAASGQSQEKKVSYHKALRKAKPPLEKAERERRRLQFVQASEPGEGLAPLAAELVEKLRLPDGEDCFLVPAFLRLVRELHEAGREFSIAFRTFGEDVPAVARDWNRFCRGEHPLHAGFTLLGRELDMGRQDSFGYMWRGGKQRGGDGETDEERIALVLGTCDLAPGTDSNGWAETTADEALKWYKAKEDVTILHGVEEVQGFFNGAAENGRTVATRECYPHWASCNLGPGSGKLHFVDRGCPPQYHALFLDDNAHLNIVDARCADDIDCSLPFEEVLGTYLVAVDPLHLVHDEGYLADCVASAEAALAAKLAASQ